MQAIYFTNHLVFGGLLLEINFECQCGEMISDFTRGEEMPNVRLACDECGAHYAVTVTTLVRGTEARAD